MFYYSLWHSDYVFKRQRRKCEELEGLQDFKRTLSVGFLQPVSANLPTAGTQAQGLRARGHAGPRPPQQRERSCHSETPTSRAQPPNAATRTEPKARSEALFPTPSEGVGWAAPAPLPKFSGIAIPSSGFVTYRLCNPAAPAAAPKPSRVAAILAWVRRRGTGLPLRGAAYAPRRRRRSPAGAGLAPWTAHSMGSTRRCYLWGTWFAPGCLQPLRSYYVNPDEERNKEIPQ